MKALCVACLLLIAGLAIAAQVHLAWDPNREPDLAGYRLYRGTNSRAYVKVLEIVGTSTNALSDTIAGRTNFFALTAFNTNNLESDYSDEVWVVVPGGDPPSQVQGVELLSADPTHTDPHD